MKKINSRLHVFCIVLLSTFLASDTGAQTWKPVGSPGFSEGAAGQTTIAIDKYGTPYVAFQDATVNFGATVMKYNGINWVTVGNPGFSAGPVAMFSSISMALDTGGTPYVVYGDGASIGYGTTVMKYYDTGWVNVGIPDFSSPQALSPSIGIDKSGTPYDFYSGGVTDFKASVMKYNDTDWITVGIDGFSSGQANNGSIAIDSSGTPYVVYEDDTSGKATVMKYDGSNWITVGSPKFSAGAVWAISIAIDRNGTPYVAYSDIANGQKATVMRYNGSSWVPVGSPGFSIGNVNNCSIAVDSMGTPYVVYQDCGSATCGATVMKYDGSNWLPVGSPEFSAGEAVYTDMAINTSGTPYVVYGDSVNEGKATVMKLDTSTRVTTVDKVIANSLATFPNPSDGYFKLNLHSAVDEKITITITNVLGEKLDEQITATNTDTEIQLNVPKGIYILSAWSGNIVLNARTTIIIK